MTSSTYSLLCHKDTGTTFLETEFLALLPSEYFAHSVEVMKKVGSGTTEAFVFLLQLISIQYLAENTAMEVYLQTPMH